ncbi:SpaH/EbpB family LPXTG-anchored major pilin (plasmid) [Paenarthrobacter sp. OM7]|uniref:SpaH/EbpB family LPXTG-anchored major pilin n=1 Tax=Paenarthrobacter sp. OM7 TaxID=3041264 RepID=UPI0024682950|nr:SpaH/EbpB family LPXTG-anchored major pilin [Paenarthrobacter sp. OM7]WGM22905.1 SpaH/EbpB family LPXTG-anchored major pilin [Paenarthrobacter sp. OM7]
MSNRSSRRLWKTAATTIAGAVLAMSFSIAPASAAPVVDDTKTGSITIHKFERPPTPTGLPNNGTAVDTTGLTPLPGIEFTIQQVNNIDLATNAGWESANNLSTAFSPADPEGSITTAGYTLGSAQAKSTDTAGTAAFGSLPLGLYLVTETNYPAGVTPSAPFLVSVPLTDPDNKDAWLYDVNVYPKNSVTGAEKTVSEADDVKLGDTIEYTITGDIPNEAVIDGYKIVDNLDPKLTYVDATATLVDGTIITEGTDYTVGFDASTNTVSIVFTPAGRAVLAAHNDTRVKVTLSATVNTIGEIENEALVYPNNGSFTITPGQPGGPIVTPPVVTKWGEITLQKVNQNGTALAGAAFSVFSNQADAQAGTNPIVLNGQSTFTVAADGTLTISGLRYSDWANGAAVAPGSPDYITYYLVETAAPTGYELLAEPISFLINATTTTAGVDLQVKNIPSNSGFQLPLTGGTGTGLLYAAGTLLVVGAGLLLIRSRRSTTNS